jgi:hypothetical protein
MPDPSESAAGRGTGPDREPSWHHRVTDVSATIITGSAARPDQRPWAARLPPAPSRRPRAGGAGAADWPGEVGASELERLVPVTSPEKHFHVMWHRDWQCVHVTMCAVLARERPLASSGAAGDSDVRDVRSGSPF